MEMGLFMALKIETSHYKTFRISY